MARNINDVCNELRPYIPKRRLLQFDKMHNDFAYKAPEQAFECFTKVSVFLLDTFKWPPTSKNGWRCAEIFTTKTREQLLEELSV